MAALDPKAIAELLDSDIGKLVKSAVRSTLESALEGPAAPVDGERARKATDSAAEKAGEAADDAAEALADAAEKAGDAIGSAVSKAGQAAKSVAGRLDGAAKPALVVAAGVAGIAGASAAISAARRRAEQSGSEDAPVDGEESDATASAGG